MDIWVGISDGGSRLFALIRANWRKRDSHFDYELLASSNRSSRELARPPVAITNPGGRELLQAGASRALRGPGHRADGGVLDGSAITLPRGSVINTTSPPRSSRGLTMVTVTMNGVATFCIDEACTRLTRGSSSTYSYTAVVVFGATTHNSTKSETIRYYSD